jgi:spore coat protein U-like protein
MSLTVLRRAVTLCVALLLGIGLAGAARATCTTVASQTITLPPASSYDILASRLLTASIPAGLSCSGSLVTLLATNNAYATIVSNSGFKMKASKSSDTIPYQISADPGGTSIFTSGAATNYMSSYLLTLLNILSSTSFNPSLYAKVIGAPNVPADVYTDTLNIHWSWSVCSGANVLGACLLGSASDTGTADITVIVTITVSKDCRISAPDISFGNQPLVSQFQPVSQAVLVDCTKDATYTVAFSAGKSGTSRPWRTMKDSAGDSLQYNIYLSDGVTIWDTTNPQNGTQPGTGGTTPSIPQPYVAKINPNQITPPMGQYSDSVNLIVSF